MARLIYIDAKWPTPRADAGSQRAVQLVRELIGMGFEVDVAAIYPTQTAEIPVAVHDFGGGAPLPAGEDAVLGHIERHGAEYDAAVVAWSRVAQRVIGPLRAANPGIFLVFDTLDVNHVREFRHARVSRNANILRRAMAMKQAELAAVAAADRTLTTTGTDAEILRAEVPGALIDVVTMATPERTDDVPGPEARSGLVYLGNYQAWHNVDAVTHLVQDILPRVRVRAPGTRVTLAGAGRHPMIDELAAEDVGVVGYVPDVRDVFDSRRAFVCPLRIGSGIKGKLLTALSMGLPIIGTPIAIEGMDLAHERDCLVATTSEEFAEAIDRIQTDDRLWMRLSAAGRETARSRFDLHTVRRQLEGVFAGATLGSAAGVTA